MRGWRTPHISRAVSTRGRRWAGRWCTGSLVGPSSLRHHEKIGRKFTIASSEAIHQNGSRGRRRRCVSRCHRAAGRQSCHCPPRYSSTDGRASCGKNSALIPGGSRARPCRIDSNFGKLLPCFPTVPVLGIKRECGAGKLPNSAAAPATVSGESFVIGHWESRSWEGDDGVTTREPGDLPSAVVTREDVGRGVQALASLGSREARW